MGGSFMKKKGKPWHFFVTALLILLFAYTAFFGISSTYGDITTTYVKGAADIRFGIDIRGGVEVTFAPEGGYDATDEQMDAAEAVINKRLVSLNITDSEVYVDNNKDRIILRFPWKEDETSFNPEQAIQEIGATAKLEFRKGTSADGELVLEGADIKSATPAYGPVTNSSQNEYYIHLELEDSGKDKFAEATTELAADKGTISIWMDGELLSAPTVNSAITDGVASITGSFTQEEVITLANQINSGALPFALEAESYSTISPTLGSQSLSAMVLAGIIAFVLVALFMIINYRLPGAVASLALLGQCAATIAAISGYFAVFNSFTLTLPGIAGIILAIGMGVDANVITAERIREELRSGKSLDSAISSGFSRGLAPIVDGNVTVIIVSLVLMAAFGPTDGFLATLFAPVFSWFGAATEGTIYSFGYTLLAGVVLNFVFGVGATRIMLRGLSRIQALRKPVLYGGAGNANK